MTRETVRERSASSSKAAKLGKKGSAGTTTRASRRKNRRQNTWADVLTQVGKDPALQAKGGRGKGKGEIPVSNLLALTLAKRGPAQSSASGSGTGVGTRRQRLAGAKPHAFSRQGIAPDVNALPSPQVNLAVEGSGREYSHSSVSGRMSPSSARYDSVSTIHPQETPISLGERSPPSHRSHGTPNPSPGAHHQSHGSSNSSITGNRGRSLSPSNRRHLAGVSPLLAGSPQARRVRRDNPERIWGQLSVHGHPEPGFVPWTPPEYIPIHPYSHEDMDGARGPRAQSSPLSPFPVQQASSSSAGPPAQTAATPVRFTANDQRARELEQRLRRSERAGASATAEVQRLTDDFKRQKREYEQERMQYVTQVAQYKSQMAQLRRRINKAESTGDQILMVQLQMEENKARSEALEIQFERAKRWASRRLKRMRSLYQRKLSALHDTRRRKRNIVHHQVLRMRKLQRLIRRFVSSSERGAKVREDMQRQLQKDNEVTSMETRLALDEKAKLVTQVARLESELRHSKREAQAEQERLQAEVERIRTRQVGLAASDATATVEEMGRIIEQLRLSAAETKASQARTIAQLRLELQKSQNEAARLTLRLEEEEAQRAPTLASAGGTRSTPPGTVASTVPHSNQDMMRAYEMEIESLKQLNESLARAAKQAGGSQLQTISELNEALAHSEGEAHALRKELLELRTTHNRLRTSMAVRTLDKNVRYVERASQTSGAVVVPDNLRTMDASGTVGVRPLPPLPSGGDSGRPLELVAARRLAELAAENAQLCDLLARAESRLEGTQASAVSKGRHTVVQGDGGTDDDDDDDDDDSNSFARVLELTIGGDSASVFSEQLEGAQRLNASLVEGVIHALAPQSVSVHEQAHGSSRDPTVEPSDSAPICTGCQESVPASSVDAVYCPLCMSAKFCRTECLGKHWQMHTRDCSKSILSPRRPPAPAGSTGGPPPLVETPGHTGSLHDGGSDAGTRGHSAQAPTTHARQRIAAFRARLKTSLAVLAQHTPLRASASGVGGDSLLDGPGSPIVPPHDNPVRVLDMSSV